MREPNKNFVYSLEDLTSEEYNIFLKETDNEDVKQRFSYYYHAFFSNILEGDSNVVNAKELFYTLENIQVDCSELTEEQIKEMADIFENAGYKVWNYKGALNVSDVNYLLEFTGIGVFVSICSEEKTTITYEKFMELFGNKEKNFKKFTIREYSTGDFMDLGRDVGVITAKNKDHAWELYKETHKLKDSEKGFYSFTESATTSVVTKEGNNDLAEETSVYDDMLSIIEKGKQQGLKVAITFERL